MPVNESSCGRRPPGRHNFKLNGVRNVQDPGMVIGTMHDRDNITSADGHGAIQPAQAATHESMGPKNRVNGYVSHGFWSKRTETSCVSKKQEKKSNSNYRAEQPESNGSVLVHMARSLETQPVSTAVFEQKPATPTSKSQRKKKKPWHDKRKEIASTEYSVPPVPEDWENEIQEVKVKNWEKMTFGIQPFGPEDVVNFTLRDLSLEGTKAPLWQVTSNNYFPSAHHQRPMDWRPMDWFRYTPFCEPGQFSDVED